MKVGLMGLGRGGQQVAEALLASSWCDLVAVASREPRRIEAFAEAHPGIVVYDDFRSLVVENPLEALFVALPPFLRGKYLSLAADRGLPVWMLTPPARRFDEALTLMDMFAHADCPLVVARAWGIESALQAETLEIDQLGRFFFARGNVMTCWADDLDWRGDSVRAGGGVLLDRGYELIDTLVQIMGMPSTVYAVGKAVSRPGCQFPYDTEDTVALVCQFSGGMVAAISACWTSGPERCDLEIHGTSGSVHIDQRKVVCRDRAGETVIGEQTRPTNPLTAPIEAFLASLRSNPEKIQSTLRDHLSTMAVIQAAYLSTRTGEPENPGTIFEIHDVKESDLAGD